MDTEERRCSSQISYAGPRVHSRTTCSQAASRSLRTDRSRTWGSARRSAPATLESVQVGRACSWKPRARRAYAAPAGTVSFTVYFHAGADELATTGSGYLLGQARAKRFFNGYFDQSAEPWNEAGMLRATSHQVVYFKQ